MEGFAAFDGGPFLKAGLLACGTLLFAATAFGQSADPLAPLSTAPAPSDTRSPVEYPAPQPVLNGAAPTVIRVAPPSVATVPVPKDWRGVFDAIDAGNWASAQA